METRAYFFGNMYLSSIQQGIQAAHVTSELFTKYPYGDSPEANILFQWATKDKTMILLNAGYTEEIYSLVEFFNTSECNLPFDMFHESDAALDGALTCFGAIIPDYIYTAAQRIRSGEIVIEDLLARGGILMGSGKEIYTAELTLWEANLALRLTQYGLAH